MNSEETIYDRDEQTDVPAPSTRKNGTWKTVAMGAGTGIVFGGATTFLTSGTAAETEAEVASEVQSQHPNPLVDDEISIASGVEDEMSFSQAFASARAETGSGGVFEWRGNLYSTFTAEEWDGMSAQERADFNDHFAWSSNNGNNDTTTTDTAQATTAAIDEAEVVGHEDITNEEVAVVDTDEPEIEVLGVVYDAQDGAGVTCVNMDEQEAFLIEVDNGPNIPEQSDNFCTPPTDDLDYINDCGSYDG